MTVKIIQCPSCTALLEIHEEGLVRELQWFELLDWNTMPDVFDKLPQDIKNEIRIMLNEGSDWSPKKETRKQ